MITKSKVNLVLALSLGFILSSCVDTMNPESVAKAYLKALQRMDIDTAISLSTQESKEVLGLLKSYLSVNTEEETKQAQENSKKTIHIIATEKDTSKALITYKSGSSSERQLLLRRERAGWRVEYPVNR